MPSQPTYEELLQELQKVKSQIRYGLVWEDKPEKVVQDCQTNYPILKEMEDKAINTDNQKPVNLLIEGDNYHALQVLNYTHKGKVDVIYIDPPYNTGEKDFSYNDTYVDKEDDWRHSKWLSFMSQRLNLAKDLLKSTGVVFLSINEQELCQLKLLCDKIFGDKNNLSLFTIKVRHEERILKGDKDFHEVTEFLLMYRKSPDFKTIKREQDNTSFDEYVYTIKELTNTPEIVQMGSKTVQVFKPDEYKIIKTDPGENSLKKINIRGSIKEGNSSGRFFMRYLSNLQDNYAYLYKADGIGGDSLDHRYFLAPTSSKKANGDYFQGVPVKRSDIKEVPYPNFFDFEEDFNKVGYEGGVEFRNGKKPISFLSKVLEMGGIKKNKDSLVLDFFAGSGSTGQAVLELNKEDGGNRQFILVTNNELNGVGSKLVEEQRPTNISDKEFEDWKQQFGICRRVTYQRLNKVITGYTNSKEKVVEGLGGNLKYYRTAFVPKSISKDQVRTSLTAQCTNMLQVKEGIFELYKSGEEWQIFRQDNKSLGVFYEVTLFNLDDFVQELKNLNGEKSVYCFSFGSQLDRRPFEDVKDCKLEAIPEPILEIYNELNKLNK